MLFLRQLFLWEFGCCSTNCGNLVQEILRFLCDFVHVFVGLKLFKWKKNLPVALKFRSRIGSNQISWFILSTQQITEITQIDWNVALPKEYINIGWIQRKYSFYYMLWASSVRKMSQTNGDQSNCLNIFHKAKNIHTFTQKRRKIK